MGNEKVSKSIEEQKLIPKLEKPHQKTYLTTPMGRFVERASYLDLFIFTPISTLNKLFKLNRRITTFFIHNDADRM